MGWCGQVVTSWYHLFNSFDHRMEFENFVICLLLCDFCWIKAAGFSWSGTDKNVCSSCWTNEFLSVLTGIARMVDGATKHLVSRVRHQFLGVHKNKQICQKMEWIKGENIKTIWKCTVHSMIPGDMLTWTVCEEFGNMINILLCVFLGLPGWWAALPSTAWWGNHILHALSILEATPL